MGTLEGGGKKRGARPDAQAGDAEPWVEVPVAPGAEPPGLRFLRVMVTILVVTMIAGLVTVIALIVINLPKAIRVVPDPLALPASITLPEGARATAFTRGRDWFAIVTDDDRLLIYDAESGELQRQIEIRPGPADAGD